MDLDWWKAHQARVAAEFCGEPWSQLTRSGVHRLRLPYRAEDCKNSGAGAIALAAHLGARRVILLGYDCKFQGGRRHWHADHRKGEGSGNAGSVGKWPDHFRRLRLHLPDIEIINCSRDTALTVFRRANLEDALG